MKMMVSIILGSILWMLHMSAMNRNHWPLTPPPAEKELSALRKTEMKLENVLNENLKFPDTFNQQLLEDHKNSCLALLKACTVNLAATSTNLEMANSSLVCFQDRYNKANQAKISHWRTACTDIWREYNINLHAKILAMHLRVSSIVQGFNFEVGKIIYASPNRISSIIDYGGQDEKREKLSALLESANIVKLRFEAINQQITAQESKERFELIEEKLCDINRQLDTFRQLQTLH